MEYIDEFVRHLYFESDEEANTRMIQLREAGRRVLKLTMRKDWIELRILPTYLTASGMAKSAGLKSLAEMAAMTGKHENTLMNWWKDEPLAFTTMLEGCVALKRKAREANDKWQTLKS